MLDLKQVGERCTDLLRETHGGKEAAEVLPKKRKEKKKEKLKLCNEETHISVRIDNMDGTADAGVGTKRRMSAKERKDLKRRRKNEEKATAAAATPAAPAAAAPAAAAAPQHKKGKKKKKKDHQQQQQQGPQEAAPFSAAAAAMVAKIETGDAAGTLSDRLNPKHKYHDLALKVMDSFPPSLAHRL